MKGLRPLLRAVVNQSNGRWTWYAAGHRAVRLCSDLAYEELIVAHSARFNVLEAFILTMPLYEFGGNGTYLIADRIIRKEIDRSVLVASRVPLSREILEAEMELTRDVSHPGLLRRVVRRKEDEHPENLVFGSLLSLHEGNVEQAKDYMRLALVSRRRQPVAEQPASNMWLRSFLALLQLDAEAASEFLIDQLAQVECELFHPAADIEIRVLDEQQKSLALDWIALKALGSDSKESVRLIKALEDEIFK